MKVAVVVVLQNFLHIKWYTKFGYSLVCLLTKIIGSCNPNRRRYILYMCSNPTCSVVFTKNKIKRTWPQNEESVSLLLCVVKYLNFWFLGKWVLLCYVMITFMLLLLLLLSALHIFLAPNPLSFHSFHILLHTITTSTK